MGIKVIWPLDYFEGTGQASGSPQPPPSQPDSPPERKPPFAMAQGRHKHLVVCRQLEDCLSNLSFIGDQPSSNACRANNDPNVELGRSHNLKRPHFSCRKVFVFKVQVSTLKEFSTWLVQPWKKFDDIVAHVNLLQTEHWKSIRKGETNLDIENLQNRNVTSLDFENQSQNLTEKSLHWKRELDNSGLHDLRLP